MGSSIFLITTITIKTPVANPLAKRGNYGKYPPMSNDANKRPSVPGGPAIPGYGGDGGQGVLRIFGGGSVATYDDSTWQRITHAP
ncbi:unnamed protein product [Parnassius apollo]|uniref:(apollo) hypothetical protein n=1 Tax=Parnassius apollo TaxID=110799 RepID=A0A8S3XZE0_PARAO|nr:unnamed protein product [Parnassius apollo]